MRVCFQLLDCDYVLLDGRPVIRLFGKTLDEKTVCAFFEGFKPYFYALPSEEVLERVKGMREVERVEVVKRYLPIGFSEQRAQLLKLVLRDPAKVPTVREQLRAESFEADIPFKYRLMADHGLFGMRWYRVEGDAVQTDNVLTQLKLKAHSLEEVKVEADTKLKVLSLDLEIVPMRELPNSSRDAIAIISLAFDPPFNGNRSLVLLRKTTKADGVLCFEDEASMLQKFLEIVHSYDPDVITGYNLNNFDLPYLLERLRINKLSRALGRCSQKPLSCRKTGTRCIVGVPGRVIVDVYVLVQEAVSKGLLKLKHYDLGSVALELIGEQKLDMSLRELKQCWEMQSGLESLIEYARKDAILALKLLLEKRMLDKFIALAQVSGLLLQDVLNGGESSRVECLLLREFNQRGFVIPNKPTQSELKQRQEERQRLGLKGALVLEPVVGLHEQCVIYLDFKSLYPSIFYAYNICPTTLLTKESKVQKITTPYGVSFVAKEVRQGIFAEVVHKLVEERNKVKAQLARQKDPELKRMLNAMQLALKYMANAFYGYTGYLRARFYVLELANAITSCGREILMKTKHLVERFGYKVVYGDTDSIQIKTNTQDVEEALRIGEQLMESINRELSPAEIKVEGIFKTELILAKKRYVGWAWEKSNSDWVEHVVAKGIETVRRDWCELTSQTLTRVLDILLKEKSPEKALQYAREVIRKLQAGQVPIQLLVISKGLTKSPHSYKGMQPHAELVKRLKEREPTRTPAIGDRIGYVIVKGSQLISQRAELPEIVISKGLEVDARYYLENQLLPPLERVFEALGMRARLLGTGKQLSLTELKPQVEVLESVEGVVCDACNRTYARPPLLGKCVVCGGRLLFYSNQRRAAQAIL